MEGTPFGRYRLLDLLGAGGMGRVYRAHDTGTDRTVALKVLPEQFAADAGFRERFRREAHAAARLTDPHVIPIHDYGEIDGQLFLDMRLVEGTDLGAIIDAGPLPAADAVHCVEQVAQALDAAHRAGLLHRDVKPSNIIVTPTGFAYLIDFGIAKDLAATGITSTGATVGTFAYMAPERLGAGAVDGRADVYALGCVLHKALTGELPFPGENIQQQIVAHLSAPPPAPSQVRAGVPAGLDAIVRRGMAKQPDERYPTAGSLAAAARAAVDAVGAGYRSGTAPTVLGPGSPPDRAARTAPTDIGTGSGTAPNEGFRAAPTVAGPGPAAPPNRGAPTADPTGRRRWLLIGASVALPVLVLAVAAMLVLRPDRADSAGSATTTSPAAVTGPATSTGTATPGTADLSPTAAPVVTAQLPAAEDTMASFVLAHYADLPGDPGASWTRFTPAYQRTVGRAAHTEFWAGIEALAVEITNVDAARNRVSLELTLTGTDGTVRREGRVLTLEPTGGSYLIAAAERIS
ncbi:protein kinase [Nocardia sp. NPDC057353]|uniref:serine/threonine-protein kinase n=1 Tax=Nocardia sp. NPDC057353 TaxID=3346104 RepID=UPI00362BAFC4